ncbi:enoyl-CoA hydratase/isomerase family protein [Xanthobacter sp. DSM 24535]|uniref:enoyl-CoA hydratase/isomerase family protein n=1 Tax=Roseixanthobacter psychrophilus TaxID=3119917 RepID=UPI00372CDB4B
MVESHSAELRVERVGSALNLTLTRPEKANALSATLVEAIIAWLEEADRDGTDLVVFRGDGRNFCAGFDLGDLDAQSDGDLVFKLLRIETMLQAVANAKFVTLALAQGKVIGAGCDLFCACSERIATPDAGFRMPGWRFGVALGTRRLSARVGSDAARSLLLDTRAFTAIEANEIGLATRLAEVELWPEVIEATAVRASALGAPSRRMLLELTAVDTRALDMAALVASAGRPGLRERIKAYRAERP